MIQFVTLVKYSDEAFEDIIETDAHDWLTEVRQVINAAGGELKEHYLTLGEYDAIAVVEFPTKEDALKTRMLVASASGVEEARPHVAFSEDQSRPLIDEISW